MHVALSAISAVVYNADSFAAADDAADAAGYNISIT